MSFWDSALDVLTGGATYVGRKLGASNADVLSGGLTTIGRALGVLPTDSPQLQSLIPPPLPPDATDEEIRQSVLLQRRRLLAGQGQGSTFLSGPLGDPTSFATSKSSAGGF